MFEKIQAGDGLDFYVLLKKISPHLRQTILVCPWQIGTDLTARHDGQRKYRFCGP